MFTVHYSDKVFEYLKNAAKTSPSLLDRLEGLEENPFARAKETGLDTIGAYYISAGRYCILCDIDPDAEVVTILSVRLRGFVYRVMNKPEE
jgi:mRNA-degrading endonuclease RelE of RelBE toxin-antitoxin system